MLIAQQSRQTFVATNLYASNTTAYVKACYLTLTFAGELYDTQTRKASRSVTELFNTETGHHCT